MAKDWRDCEFLNLHIGEFSLDEISIFLAVFLYSLTKSFYGYNVAITSDSRC